MSNSYKKVKMVSENNATKSCFCEPQTTSLNYGNFITSFGGSLLISTMK